VAPRTTPRVDPAAAALAPLPTVERELEVLRGLRFLRPVERAVQDQAALRTFVRAEIAREMGPEKNALFSRGVEQLGFTTGPVNLAKLFEDVQVAQVAAYYDPRQNKFFVIEGNAGPGLTDVVVAHELMHALQDQHFDLTAFGGGDKPQTEPPFGDAGGLSDDQKIARQFVSEGEATFMMMAFGAADREGGQVRVSPAKLGLLRAGLSMIAGLEPGQMGALMGGDAEDPDTKEAQLAMKALDDAPPFISYSLTEPYTKGGLMVAEVFSAGGWPAVAALYGDPPDSTEQVLHPKEKLIAQRDPPTRIDLPDEGVPAVVRGAKLVMRDVLGELLWRAYFATWKHRDPREPAADWGGDRYWIWSVGKNPVALIATSWDSEAAAARFSVAYAATLDARFPRARSLPASLRKDHGGRLLAGGRVVALRRWGRDVDIVDGVLPADARSMLDYAAAARRTPLR
jgi:hypothetical protein